MNIAIIGTRGIPNNYGGFEQFAEKFSSRVVALGHQVTVYSSHRHSFQGNQWEGVTIVHCKDLEYAIGSTGQFIYDLNCIIHSRKQQFDIILQLGYTSSAIWGWLMPRKKTVIITNMDGLEWKRHKYIPIVRRFLLYSERLVVMHSDQLIADAIGIRDYLKHKYKRFSTYIPYGADAIGKTDEEVLKKYHLEKYQYNMLVARLEPENNIEMILDGSLHQSTPKAFLVIGNHNTKYGQYLKQKYTQWDHIRFLSAVYITDDLNNLRFYSGIYFHGHSVGGTNPSLIEAMGCHALVCAHNNIFNKEVLGDDGYYFSDSSEIERILNHVNKKEEKAKLINNLYKVQRHYHWDYIVENYLQCFRLALEERKKEHKIPIRISDGY